MFIEHYTPGHATKTASSSGGRKNPSNAGIYKEFLSNSSSSQFNIID